MDESGSGDEAITLWARIGDVERGAALCHRGVDRQDPAAECRRHLPVW
jgi:hypothetical protein